MLKSVEYRRLAEAAEQMAAIVSYRPDKERCLAEAQAWRKLEQTALAREARTRH